MILFGSLCLLTGSLQADQAGETDQKKRLAEQKLKLVDMLLNSPASKALAADPGNEGTPLIEQSRQLVTQARQALAAHQYDAAVQTLDEALRHAFKASSRPQPVDANLAESRLKQQFQDFAEQITGYRASLLDLSKEGRNAEPARKLLARIDRLSDEARQLYSAGQLAESNKKMAEAYKLAVAEISALRAGQEVVMSLKFETPADEFAYELKRYQSNEILVGMMIGEGRAEGERRKLVEGFLNEAARMKEEARHNARSNEYKQAVGSMEKANAQLNRALQAMGVPVF
ncbi:MAG: hypothetical protein D3M94_05865 [Rhodocyclales bacterium GT-UBC]|nr:MAG: hypothetical protein D3M94_05865 [Rhodocyclales bacterium GT-UBC]